MATTSAFGWETPDDTDLVKDGAAAIRTLGNSIDTSMSELKGGTTGQILSKTSNTDMDFTWVANDQGDITGITASSPLTGGGTSGAVTVGIQDASTSVKGAVQLSDSISSTSTTLAATANAVKTTYDLANSAYAGGFTNNYYAGKNKIINGDFDIWQRGTSGFSAPGYTADRWRYAVGNGAAGVSRQAFTPGAAPVSGYEGKFFLRYALSSASSSGTPTLEQRIEDVQTEAGQTVTVSFWAKATSGASPTSVVLTQNFGSGGSTAVDTTVVSSPSYTTSWVRYSYSVAVPSISGKTVGTSSYLSLVFNFALNSTFTSFDIWGVQVEAGSVATPFQTATGTLAGELAACQRYYVRVTAGGDNYVPITHIGGATSTTAITLTLQPPTTLRAAASSIEFANLWVYGGGTSGFGFLSVSSLSMIRSSNSMLELAATVTGATTGAFYRVQPNNAAGYIGVVAEL
jgi:hypothetical protein